jgi:23S rRNA pseudouridine2605 synthase
MTTTTTNKPERIAKRLARAGLCSRREAERWIAERRVAVDGHVLDSPAFTVTAASRITVDGKPLKAAEPARLWRYHKPAGLVTTHRDPAGRPTIFAALPKDLPRVISIGRLDLPSEGLLLLTNDGALARHLELPATGWIRRYRVRAYGHVDPEALAKLKAGVTVAGVRYGPIEASLERKQGRNAWLIVALGEGKNREVRKVLEHVGLTVNRLIRISYGPFQLGHLEKGAVEEVTGKVLREQLGKAGAALIGVSGRTTR